MADSAQDRRLPATQRKIQKSRRDGQIARSRDLAHFAVLAAGIGGLSLLGSTISDWLSGRLAAGLRFDVRTLASPQLMLDWLMALVLPVGLVMLPLLAGGVALVAGSSLLAGGWNFSFKAMEPKLEKINPLAGFKRLFSGQQMIQTLKACLLALLIGSMGAAWLWTQWPRYAELLAMPLPAALGAGGQLMLGGLLGVLGLLAAFALVDVPLQKQLLLRRLRMSIKEVKEEMKQVEGNAEIKGKQKALMREAAGRRMLAAVPRADLVVMNPTHYAVALKYDESAMAAPKVVAKGADLLALRIRDIAKESRVPVLQAPPLARALYTHCEVDREIPARLFTAVAQVLAWVYGLRDAMAAGRPLADAPVPEVPADLDPHQARPPHGAAQGGEA